MENDLVDIFHTHKVPKLAIIILNACWLANRNPEAIDKTLFKDEKKNYRKKAKDT